MSLLKIAVEKLPTLAKIQFEMDFQIDLLLVLIFDGISLIQNLNL